MRFDVILLVIGFVLAIAGFLGLAAGIVGIILWCASALFFLFGFLAFLARAKARRRPPSQA